MSFSTGLKHLGRSAVALLTGGVMLSIAHPVIAQSDSTIPQSIPTGQDDARFTCESEAAGRYTVMYHPQSQPGQSNAWATPTELGGGWTADRRCYEIARRLEFYRPDGLLELRTDVENGYNTVCVTTEAVPGCRIVFTVPPGQDPIATRDRVFSNLTIADSGERTQGVVTYADGGGDDLLNRIGGALGIELPSSRGTNRMTRDSGAINLRPFLDPADGGTGERL
jgi:uncharacterized protein YndB with AHSA1/START domain